MKTGTDPGAGGRVAVSSDRESILARTPPRGGANAGNVGGGPSKSKQWSADHVRLARCAVDVRDRLRWVIPHLNSLDNILRTHTLTIHHRETYMGEMLISDIRQTLEFCANAITAALKDR